MKRLPVKKERCPVCINDAGWDLSDPADPRWCDHGVEQAKAAAAELRDRAIAARRARATGTGEPA